MKQKTLDKKALNNLNIEQNLVQNASVNEQFLFEKFHTSLNGLTTAESEDRAEEFGKNKITTKKGNSKFMRLLSSLINPFNVILIGIAIITLLTDVIFASDEPDYLTVIIIFTLVIVSSVIAFIQSEKSHTAIEKLTNLVTNEASVLRDGEFNEIPMEDIVPGDIVKLSAGDMIPADIRFLVTKDTFVAQAALTGESHPVEKYEKLVTEKHESITDLENIGFMGSNILSGSATALVLTTGNNTYFGSMADSLSGEKSLKNFERGVSAISKLLIRLTLLMVPTVFLINSTLR